MAKKALFIVIEGINGIGKSTVIEKVLTELNALDILAISVRHPGTTPTGLNIRSMLKNGTLWSPETIAYLMMDAAEILYRTVIKPLTRNGITVISDRFTLSTYVYQCRIGGVDINNISKYKEALGIPTPDLHIVLYSTRPDVVTLKRISERDDEEVVVIPQDAATIKDLNSAYCDSVDRDMVAINNDGDIKDTVIKIMSAIHDKQKQVNRSWYVKCLDYIKSFVNNHY